jgi:hypothetical protein
VFVPGVQQGMRVRVPRRAFTFVLALFSVLGVLFAWAAFAARPASDEIGGGSFGSISLPEMHSVALIIPDGPVDHLVVQQSTPAGKRKFVADFPSTFTLHGRGLASPTGDAIAVLWVDGSPATAHLTIVHPSTGARLEIAEPFDYFSGLAWKPRGNGLAALGAVRRDQTGRFDARILGIDTAVGTAELIATFGQVFEAHPIGYSPGEGRLLLVVVDESGSALWSVASGKSQREVQLSAGQTRDWVLSPNGERLAFTEVFRAGGNERSLGRVLNIATGDIAGVGPDGVQVAPTWRPDSVAPLFGGPDGDIQLAGGSTGTYLVPHAWGADGALVATVQTEDGSPGTLQLIQPDSRIVLADEPGATFLGFVTDIE